MGSRRARLAAWRQFIVAGTLTLGIGLPAHAEVVVYMAGDASRLRYDHLADRVIVLNRADNALHALRFRYPGSPEAAKREALQRLQSPQGRQALAAIKVSSENLFAAWQQGVERLPAVVVDGQYVVYGGDSVATALSLIEAYRDDPR